MSNRAIIAAAFSMGVATGVGGGRASVVDTAPAAAHAVAFVRCERQPCRVVFHDSEDVRKEVASRGMAGVYGLIEFNSDGPKVLVNGTKDGLLALVLALGEQAKLALDKQPGEPIFDGEQTE